MPMFEKRVTRLFPYVVVLCALAGCRAEAPRPDRIVLEAENARVADTTPLVAAATGEDVALARVAVRALGRLERPELREAVLALAASPDAGVRREAANALGYLGAAADYSQWLAREPSGDVRGALYETIGRVAPVEGFTETVLAGGLDETDPAARLGAAHGLEAFVRLNRRTHRPADATVAALRRAASDGSSAEIRELALIALSTAGDRDPDTLERALDDPEPQVRRLAVMGLRVWVDDPSPLVRYEALRVAPTCERAAGALDDHSGHVVLLAVDLLGTLPCPAGAIEPLLSAGQPWRVRAHAVVSLSRVAPESARRHVAALSVDPAWQARAYAATAAKIIGDDEVRATLAADPEPNVVIAAMTQASEAVSALTTSHRGLLLEAARLLEGAAELPGAVPAITDAFVRLSREDRPTSRDARLALLERLSEAPVDAAEVSALSRALTPWLADRDPVVASRVADVLSAKTGRTVTPATTVYADDSLAPAEYIDGLRGANARISMQGVGTFTIELLVDEAPATVAVFAAHAERGGYDGTTLHRVVPNFVLQGGSHGANEYDGAVGPFMRDELGLVRHLRGTLGISTRGRDTGDGQIFINLVDNFRLDHQYTVWARVIDGMDVVDRILEGDVIDEVRIRRTEGR